MFSVCCSYQVLEAKLAPCPCFCLPCGPWISPEASWIFREAQFSGVYSAAVIPEPRGALEGDVEGEHLWSYNWQAFSELTFIRASPFPLFCLSLTGETGRLGKVEMAISIPPGWFSSVQSLSHVRLFVTPWIAAHQASLSITNSRSSLRLTSWLGSDKTSAG